MAQRVGRWRRALAALVIVPSLAGCNEFGQVGLAEVPKAGRTIAVLGLDASHGSISVGMEYNLPEGGTCAPTLTAEAGTNAGVRYFAFAVTPGSYFVSFFNSTANLAANDPRAFAVPGSHKVYIGTFVNDPSAVRDFNGHGQMRLGRDLNAAKQALGSAGDGLELAQPIDDFHPSGTALCAF